MNEIATDAHPVPIAQGLQPTPFYDRLKPFDQHHHWGDWAGYRSARLFNTTESEYFAIRNQATLFDVSPMCKYKIEGPDALQVINRLIIRNVEKIRTGRVGYALWCDEEGMVIDDGTIFRLQDDKFFLLCQEYMYSWLLDCAWGFDVSISDESNALCGLALQGPTSFSILKAAQFTGVETMKPFDVIEIEPGYWISRTGYTGDLGYEIWTRPENAITLWDRLWSAGQLWGLVPIGVHALEIARLEAGFLGPSADFQPVHIVSRIGRGRTPFELGFGKMVDFNKGHFNGRRALLQHAKTGPRYSLTRLDIEGKYPGPNAFVYHGKRKKVGHITSASWSPTTKRNIAFAELESPYGLTIRNDLWVEIDINKDGRWFRKNAKATVIDGPFFQNKRARATPPGPY